MNIFVVQYYIMKLQFTLLSILFFLIGYTQHQFTLNAGQPPALQANAGNNVSIAPEGSIQIGGANAALFGYGDYTFQWTPTTGLSNPNIANPIASPNSTTTYTLLVTDAKSCKVESSVTVTVDPALNIHQVDVINAVSIYPNPNKGQFTVSFSENLSAETSITVFDLSGKLVFRDFVEKQINTLDLSNFNNGYYFLKIENNSFSTVKPFIINK